MPTITITLDIDDAQALADMGQYGALDRRDCSVLNAKDRQRMNRKVERALRASSVVTDLVVKARVRK